MTTMRLVLSCLICVTSSVLGEAQEPALHESAGDASSALSVLLEGNKRFVEAKCTHPHESRLWRQEIEKAQHPVAVIVGCSDSRVVPELIFDRGLGDLFVVRVAGNIVDTDVTASVEYAIDHLNTHLVIVLGHSGCGAVSAAVDHAAESNREPDEVVSLLYRIEPALAGIPKDLSREAKVAAAVRNNVERSVEHLSHVPDLMKSLKKNKLVLVGAVYDMHTGKVLPISRTDAKGHQAFESQPNLRTAGK